MKTRCARLASGLVFLGVLILSCASTHSGALHAQNIQKRQGTRVDPKVLDSYLGQYELAPKLLLTLRRFRERLTAQITGQPPLAVYAENETRFFWKIVDAQFTVQKDKDGKVTGLLFEQGPIKFNAKKLSDRAAEEVDLEE